MSYCVQENLLVFVLLSYTAGNINEPIMGYWKCNTKIYWDKINGNNFVEERKWLNVWQENMISLIINHTTVNSAEDWIH